MRLAIGVPSDASDEHLQFAAQLGCAGVTWAAPKIPGEGYFEYEGLIAIRRRAEKFGLALEAVENTPREWVDDIQLGTPERDRRIELYMRTVQNVGRAGIPVLTHNWRPDRLYRTGEVPGRGGAMVTQFDPEKAKDRPLSYGRPYSAEEMWANYEYFAKAVIPLAEAAGVRIAMHPDDPPGHNLGGVTRIMSSFEAFERASHVVESPAWALLFCCGCWCTMGGSENVLRGIRHFAPKNQIAYVHFRDVVRVDGKFQETVMGDGPSDIVAWLRALQECGFHGPIIDDHAPKLVGDEGWSFRARGYQTGYIAGMLKVLQS